MEPIDQFESDKLILLNQHLIENLETTINQTTEQNQPLDNLSINQINDLKHPITSPIIQAKEEFQTNCKLDEPQSLETTESPLETSITPIEINEASALSKINVANNPENIIQPRTEISDINSQNFSNKKPLLNKSQVKRPRLSMPELYLRTNTLQNVKGFLPNDDLQIELITPEKENPNKGWFREFRSLTRDFLFAATTALLIVIFVIQPVKVEGTSMLPKLHNDERIFINKFIYQFESIKRGDIVVFWYPKNPSQSFIKRVIGVPGDEVRITNGKLFINNQPVQEPYLSPEYTSNVMSNRYWMVEEHHYFVMGDNRDASNDSRAWGFVPEKYIYGKAIFRYWPLDSVGALSD
ncbi:MAG: signal peptidase I [Acidobacteria bacterium]|nr:signal peptidase I [Acidobacteriota bacterium]